MAIQCPWAGSGPWAICWGASKFSPSALWSSSTASSTGAVRASINPWARATWLRSSISWAAADAGEGLMATQVQALTDPLVIGGVSLRSRLIHGTGKFAGNAVLAECLRQAEPSMITLAVRRLGLHDGGRSELADIDLRRFPLLPNTAGAPTREPAG